MTSALHRYVVWQVFRGNLLHTSSRKRNAASRLLFKLVATYQMTPSYNTGDKNLQKIYDVEYKNKYDILFRQ